MITCRRMFLKSETLMSIPRVTSIFPYQDLQSIYFIQYVFLELFSQAFVKVFEFIILFELNMLRVYYFVQNIITVQIVIRSINILVSYFHILLYMNVIRYVFLQKTLPVWSSQNGPRFKINGPTSFKLKKNISPAPHGENGF